nr:zinc finger protein RFP-like [Pelodiscus sinensis]|eukprot:XP_025037726.1 zinc finger protein RFP-like [Pelodiscus sinensis]
MAASHLARSFQEEVTCPICLEYFTDPVSIECGHNFCQACLSQCWGESEPNFSCPQCRETITQRHLRPNYQLGNLVELVKCLRLPMGPALEGQPGCEKHQEALKLFCREDQAPICVIYRESWAHQAHKVLPIEEAAQEYKEKLQGALGLLRKQLKKAEALTSKEKEQTTEWQKTVQAKRVTIAGEFNKLHTLRSSCFCRVLIYFLHEKLVPRMENAPFHAPSANTEHRFSFSFQDAKSTLSRSENMKLQGPEAISADLQRGYKICLDMREALNRFAVDVKLDPDTAHPNLVLSEDRKSVRLGDTHQDLPDNPERFEKYPIVLGAEGFVGGRRYWEVEVGDKTKWDLGVCRESTSRKGEFTHKDYWRLTLRNGNQYSVSPTTLPMSTRPSRVGVFLDYEAGEVSFYNVTDRSHLFTFIDTFSGTLRPYFYPGGTNAAPLTICPVPAQARGNPCP